MLLPNFINSKLKLIFNAYLIGIKNEGLKFLTELLAELLAEQTNIARFPNKKVH